MVAERRMSQEELAEHLAEVLREVEERGERIEITRDGVVVAVIRPARPTLTTVQEIREKIGGLPFPGDGFGEDLERLQMDQEPIGPPTWPS
jgi:prevent-host-death family protein